MSNRPTTITIGEMQDLLIALFMARPDLVEAWLIIAAATGVKLPEQVKARINHDTDEMDRNQL